jgi:Tol biopolymer transport system component/DNA-binding winged helix-turn-helix (wHTH) protein
MDEQLKPLYEFGAFRLSSEDRLLFNKDGEIVPLAPKILDILLILVESRGHLLEKDALMQEVWQDTFVEEGNLARNVSTLRKILGETDASQSYIETIPRRGYRFIAPVREIKEEETTDVIIHERTRASIVIENDEDENLQKTKLLAPPKVSAWKRIVLYALIFLIGFGFYWFLFRRQNDNFGNFKPARLTTTGKIKRASVSPDGRYIAYAVSEGSLQSIWLRQISTGSNIQITPPAPRGYAGLTFPRNGEYLYFVAGEEGVASKLVRLPTLGGSEMKLFEDVDSPVALSPDEKQIAFLRGLPDAKEAVLIIADADGANERRLASRPFPDTFVLFTSLVWTKDGKILCVVKNGQSAELAEVDTASGEIKTTGAQKWNQIGRMTLTADGKTLIFSASDGDAAPMQIMQMAYPNGQARKITNDLSNYSDISLTADDKTLITLQTDQQSNIFVAPNSDLNQLKQITSANYDGANGLAFAPDGKIVYATKTGGLSDIWITGADGEGARQLTFDAGNNQNPTVSPDGKFIAFASNRTGATNVWLMEIDGSHPRQLTKNGNDAYPRWSPDGGWVFYQSRVEDIPNIFKIPANGGASIRLTNKISGRPTISPDGRWLATLYRDEVLKQPKLAVISTEGGAPARLFEIQRPSPIFNWTADSQAINYISTRSASSNIWQQPLEGGEPKQLTNFNGEQIFWFARSNDFQTLAIARGTTKSDVLMLSFER